MSRSGFACVLAALVVTGFGGATPAADQEQKHSGVIVEVAPPGGFGTSRLEAADLRTGDFATVTAIRSGGGWVAESIAVVRPAGAIPSLTGKARESR